MIEENDRVRIGPETGAYLKRDRYGRVIRVTAQKVHVKMDISGQMMLLTPDQIEEVWPT